MPSKKSRIQLYADECFPVTTVMELKSLGHSIVHAFDKKLIHKSDLLHLKESKKLKRVLITLDRDFISYDQVNLDEHPGVIVISAGSAIPKNIIKVCKKLFTIINSNSVKNSLLKVTASKVVKMKDGKIVNERKL